MKTKPPSDPMEQSYDPYRVLFLCTGNSARSIIAEAILNHQGGGQFIAFSAGSQPKGRVHPFAIDLLKSMNHDTEQLHSKSWDVFAAPKVPPFNFVVTVCGNAAEEVCPVWPGQPVSAHWGLPDPDAVEGSEAVIREAFAETYKMLTKRIGILMNLPTQSLDGLHLQGWLSDIDEFCKIGERSA